VTRENRDTRLSLCRPHVPHGHFKGSRYSSVGMAISLWSRRSGVRIPVGAKDFCVFQDIGSWAYPFSYSMGTGDLSSGVKPEFDHSTPSSAEVTSERSCRSTPALCLRRVDRDKIT
jgi:hypothetical protein